MGEVMLRFRKTLLPLCVLMALFSCQKISLEETATEAPSGNLIVNVFQIEQTPFSELTRAAAGDVCTRLNFAVYNTAGSRVKQINQQVENTGFGTASFQLEEGDYQLVVVAHSSSGNPTMTDPAKIQFTNANGFSDTFIHYQTVTIGEEPQTLSLSLHRIVALCRFVITDSYPSGVAGMRFYYTGGSGAFNASTGLGCVNSKQDVRFDVTSGQKQFDLYTFLHDTKGTIHLTVTALDAAGNVYSERSFDVPLEQNKITWYTGNFFGDVNSQTTTVSIDINPTWDGETHLTF